MSELNRVHLSYEGHFDAAHFLRNYNGKCANVHGHRWKVVVGISGDHLENGLLMDFKDLKQMLAELLPDHQSLNDIPPFDKINPTAENLALKLARGIRDWLVLSGRGRVRFEYVEVWESPEACARVTATALPGFFDTH